MEEETEIDDIHRITVKFYMYYILGILNLIVIKYNIKCVLLKIKSSY